MKKIIYVLLFAFAFTGICEARVPVERAPVKTKSDYLADGFFNVQHVTREEGMTVEEYASRKRSRIDRRAMRQDQKDGVYKTPEERFAEMDVDEDGYVTKEEMSAYAARLRATGRSFY